MLKVRVTTRRITTLASAAIAIAGLAFSGATFSNGVVNQIHVGSSDLCAAFGLNPGCDKNFSLSAIKFADGSVRGQYTDRFGGGGGQGFHATIDCLHVEDYGFAKVAWVSGVIQKGLTGTDDLAGQPVRTAAIDWGTSAQDDPSDFISFSYIGDPTPCYEQPDFAWGEFRGQVTIK